MYKICEITQSLLSFLVMVPSNPEGNFFQLVEAIMNFIKKEEWGLSEIAFTI